MADDYRYDFDSDSVVDSSGRPPREAPVDEDRYLYSMIRFLIEGNEKDEARMLLSCTLEARAEQVEMDDYAQTVLLDLVLRLGGPRKVYEALDPEEFISIHHSVEKAAIAVQPVGYDRVRIERAMAMVQSPSADWRKELIAVLEGKHVDNQAIGFTATQTWEGLRFRSQSEVRIAQALDNAGVMFFPNCKSRLGSKTRRRNSEADFAVMMDGVWGVLEVDGPHHEGKAAKDHERDRPFHHHGAALVQRYESLRCYSDPEGVVLEFLALLKKKAR